MPRGDGTGPWGQGSMTGRGLGYCSGYERPGFMTPGPGMGFGRGLAPGGAECPPSALILPVFTLRTN
jgi:hypothetical protein